MPRTRIRGNQEQDIDFLSESELNEFFGKTVITGTLAEDQDNDDATQDTQVLEIFNSYFPGQGIIQGQDGTIVVTGTEIVTISGAQLGVGTINTISGTVNIVGDANAFVSTALDTITINSPFDEDDVDSINTATGTVTIVGGTNADIVTDVPSSTITIDTFDDDDIDSVTTSGVTVTGNLNLETIGGISLLPDNSDSDNPTITISGGREVGQLIGNFFQIEFTNGGSTSNTWLAVSDSNLTGHRTPWVVAYQCRLAGLAFSNRNDGVDQDVQIHVSREGDGNSNTLEYTWELRDVRTAAKTDIATSELELFQGDKVAVFLDDQGGNARDVFVGIYVEIVARTDSESTENWSGNFS